MPRHFKLSARLKYWFDNTMSAGTPALIAWLAGVTVILVAVVVVFVISTGIAPPDEDQSPASTSKVVWESFMKAVGVEEIGFEEDSWRYLFAMLALMIGGLFITSTLIGVLTTGLEGKLENLRRGRSFVAESGHTVVLGWTAKTPSVVRELVLANESKRGACVVILADKDRTEMEEAIREALGGRKKTKVVCRRGDPIVPDDLDIVNPRDAKSVVILSPEGDERDGSPERAEPDAQVVKMILALRHDPEGKESHRANIVAELSTATLDSVAHLVDPDVTVVIIQDVISRIIARVALQKGLSVVVQELLTFKGTGFYEADAGSLVGLTYAAALFAYSDARLVGIHPDAKGAKPKLNPPHDNVIRDGDRLVVLADDDTKMSLPADGKKLSAKAWGVDDSLLAPRVDKNKKDVPKHVLILGWSLRVPRIICALDGYLEPGSTIVVATKHSRTEEELASHCGGVLKAEVSHRAGDPQDRAFLESLLLVDVPFNHVIVLSRSDVAPQAADTQALVALLHLRDIADKDKLDFNIISEMNDERNRVLAEVTKADDFVVSDRLISLMVAQISENRDLAGVFSEIFSPEGAELYLRSASDYVVIGKEMSFCTVVEAVRRRNETAVGYRRASESSDGKLTYGFHLNPPGTEKLVFNGHDQLIVLAND